MAWVGAPRMPTNLHGPQKRTEKRCLKHGCDRETSIVASGLGTHKEKKVCVDIHVQACRVANLLAKYLRVTTKFSDGGSHFHSFF